MEDNKQIALNVLKGAFIDHDPSVVGRYFAPGYTQHNPSLPDGPGPIPAMIAGFSDRRASANATAAQLRESDRRWSMDDAGERRRQHAL
jgi:predicted SnoaL-like aldol condensation-catalyzing enzyme